MCSSDLRHVVAIDALHDEFVGSAKSNWVKTAEALAAKKLLSSETVSRIARVFAFGQFIGNTDMHFGNLAFFIDDVVAPKPILAPVYDMLPMMWRPDAHQGELDLTPVQQQPKIAGYSNEYNEARQWAILFWQRAAELTALDAATKKACVESAYHLHKWT